jgi:tetratricopeptide (TPR) repeat protein
MRLPFVGTFSFADYEDRAYLGRLLFAGLIPLSALLVGSIHPSTLACVLLLSVITTTLLTYGGPAFDPRKSARLLLGLCFGLTAFCMLQAIPLPAGVLRTIAPETARVWADALRPLREDGPAWATLSLDPIATRIEVARGLFYANIFVSGLVVARRSEGTLFLERVLIVSTCLLAATALIHPATGMEKVFGVYTPENSFSRKVGPLLNANHLGGYITIGICVATGVLLSPRLALPKLVVGACLVLLVGAQLFVASRGAVGTTVLGVCLVLILTQRRKMNSNSVGMLVALVAVLTGVAAVVLAQSESAARQLASGDVSKLDVISQAFRLCASYPLFGVGRGAFESSFPKERLSGGNYVFTHPENIAAQWAGEWGVPVTILAFGLLAYALRPKEVTTRSHVPAGAYVAILAVGAHNLVDFSSEVPGVMAALCVCAAMTTGGTREIGHEAARTGKGAPLLALASVVFAVGTFLLRDHELGEEQRALHTLVGDPEVQGTQFYPSIRSAMLRHPASPYLPFLGAYFAATHGDQSAIPWVSRALDRSATYTVMDANGAARKVPNYGRAHLLLGRALARVSPSQARLEYRFALEQDESTFTSMRDEVHTLIASYDDAVELMPQGTPEDRLRGADAVGLRNNIAARREELTSALAAHLSETMPATVVRLDQDLLRAHPNTISALARASNRALADLTAHAPWCVLDGCERDALQASVAIQAATPERCEGHIQVASVLEASNKREQAMDGLKAAADKVDNASECLRALSMVAERAKDRTMLNFALERLIDRSCGTPDECVGNLQFAAQLEERRKNPRRALTLIRRATDLNSKRVDLHAERARLAQSIGLFSEATETFETLIGLEPTNPRWVTERDANKQDEKRRLLKLPPGMASELGIRP